MYVWICPYSRVSYASDTLLSTMYRGGTILLVAVAGGAGAYALGHTAWWPLALLSVAVLFTFLDREVRPLRGALLGGVFGGTLVGGAILWFFASGAQAEAGVASAVAGFALTASAWLISVATLALPMAAAGYCYVALKRGTLLDVPLAASLIVLAEFLRPFTFGIQTFAPESLFGAHWTFGYLGYALAGSPLLLLFATLGGVYLLSAVVVLIGALLARGFRVARRRRATLVLGALFGLLLLSAPLPQGAMSDDAETRTVVALKTTESAYFSTATIDRGARIDRLAALIQDAIARHPNTDLIVLPEDSRFVALGGQSRLAAFGPPLPNHVTLLDSARLDQPVGGAVSRVLTYTAPSGVRAHYTKRMLVPEGEYLSYLYRSILHGVGMGNTEARFQEVKAYTPGRFTTPTIAAGVPIAASLCSELYSPILQRDLAERAGLIVNLASLSRFHGNRALDGQNLAMARVRAVENGAYLLRATNFGTAYIIDHRGTVIAASGPDDSFAAISATVPLRYERTPFSAAPYAVPIAALLFVLYVWFILYRSQR